MDGFESAYRAFPVGSPKRLWWGSELEQLRAGSGYSGSAASQ